MMATRVFSVLFRCQFFLIIALLSILANQRGVLASEEEDGLLESPAGMRAAVELPPFSHKDALDDVEAPWNKREQECKICCSGFGQGIQYLCRFVAGGSIIVAGYLTSASALTESLEYKTNFAWAALVMGGIAAGCKYVDDFMSAQTLDNAQKARAKTDALLKDAHGAINDAAVALKKTTAVHKHASALAGGGGAPLKPDAGDDNIADFDEIQRRLMAQHAHISERYEGVQREHGEA